MFALPGDDGFHRVRAERACVEGQRIADDDGTSVTGVRLAVAAPGLERISCAIDAVTTGAQSESLVVKALQNMREAVTSRLEDCSWTVTLPDERRLAAH